MLAAIRRCPGDVRGTLEAAQKPPSTAHGVPKNASGTPKDAAEAPRTASDWLFLVAGGPLDSFPALLQKSTFSYVNSMVLEGSGPPESSLGALGSAAVVSFGASLRRFGVFGASAASLGALWGTGPAVLGIDDPQHFNTLSSSLGRDMQRALECLAELPAVRGSWGPED